MTVTTSYIPINWSGMNTFSDFLSNANASAAGYLFTAIDVLVFGVLFITLTGMFGWESAILSSGFIAIVLSLLFAYMGVMAWSTVGIFVGLIVVMIMYVIWSNRYD